METWKDIEDEDDIKEFNFDMINPNSITFNQGGSKIIVVGKPGTGKSTLLKSLLYNKRNLITVGCILSGSESANNFYSQFFPPLFIYNEYSEDAIALFRQRQLLAIKHLEEQQWAVLIVDDCCDNVTVFKKPLQQDMFKNGRHYKMLYILSLQYVLDIPPAIRTNVDGVFIFRETNIETLKKIYTNFAGIIPTFEKFKELMIKYTENYSALYINNSIQSNKWQDCVFWFRATPAPEDFKFGSREMWFFNNTRYDTSYEDRIFKNI
jgi:GTPase SAR1 family protein